MKKFIKRTSIVAICMLLVIVSLSLFGCQTNIEANRRRHINSINHRGYYDAPENTLTAFRLSKENGFDIVECDVKFTMDNYPVILHDSSVNRTSNGKGKINEMTLEAVRKLDFGSWKSKSYAGERIPTFEEFIDLCVELELYPYIEIKRGTTTEQAQILVDIVEDADINVTWISFDKKILTFIAQMCSDDRIGLLTYFVTEDNLRFLADLSDTVDVFIDCKYFTLTETDIKLCKKYKVPLEVWTVNSTDTIANINPYITGITSDYVNAQELFNNL